MMKNKLLNKLHNSTNEFSGLKLYEKEVVKYHTVWLESFEDYVNRKPVARSRIVKWYLLVTLLVINGLRYIIVYLNPEPWLMAMIGETMNEMYKVKVMAILVITTTFVTMTDLALFRHLEATGKLKLFDLFHTIITTNRVDGMGQRSSKKFGILCYLLVKYMFGVQLKVFKLGFISQYALLAYQASQNQQIGHNMFMLMVGSISAAYTQIRMFEVIFTKITLLVIANLYLKYRFLAVLEIIRSSAKSGQGLYRAICEHKKFGDVMGQISKFMNLAIGVIYDITPFGMVCVFLVVVDPEAQWWKRLIMGQFVGVTFVLVFVMSKMSTWIPNNNKRIPDILYPIFCNRSALRSHRLMIKTDEFIASLNKKFLGFYCFNLFKFTKLTFYQFLMGLSVTYLMLSSTG